MPCLSVHRYSTCDSNELYPSFFMVRQSFRLNLFDSEDKSTCHIETLMTICQSTQGHIAEDLNLANNNNNNNNNNNGRYECHVGVWECGSTASLILTPILYGGWVVSFKPRLLYSRGKHPLCRKVRETLKRS